MPGPKNVLVVEDSQSDRFFMGLALEEAFPDCVVHEFAYANDALSFLRSPGRSAVDVIFVDINMPRMNGFEFVDAYRDLYKELRGNAKVFIVSSSVDPKDHNRVRDDDTIAGYIEKPVSAGDLRDLV